jgi:glycerol 2-dehydrogenase (NADP+)
VHWPVRTVENGTSKLFPTKPDGSRNIDRAWDQAETWRPMEALLAEQYLEHLSKTWKIVPAVNQVELHPYNPQHKLKAYCDKQGIRLQAYSPLGSAGSPLHEDPEIKKIADKHGVSVATVLISYQVNRGVVVLPKSVTPSRIDANKEVIALDEEDMKVLDGLAAAGKQTRFVSPPWGTDFGFEDWFGPGNKNAPEGTVFESRGQTFYK